MSDSYSPLRIATRYPGDAVTFAALPDRLHFIVTDAAQPIRPGDTVQAQQNRSQAALGGFPMWRIKSAWWRDGSHAWSAQAVRQLETRYAALLERRRRLDEGEWQKAALLGAAPLNTTLEAARDELRRLRNRVEALESALGVRG